MRTGSDRPKPGLLRDLAFAGTVIIFVAVVAIGLTSIRTLRQSAHQATAASPTPTASISAIPVPQVPADDLAMARLTPELVTPLDTQVVDQGRTARLLGGYADPAQIVLFLHLGGTTMDATSLFRTNITVDDDQGMVNAASSRRIVGTTGDYVFIVEGGPHPGSDGLAHLSVAVTHYQAGNGPGVVDATWNFSIALPMHLATDLPAPRQFPLGRWTGNIEVFELTPTVVHLQLVIKGASVPELDLTTVTFLDPAGRVIGQGCGGSITVNKTQISGPDSPLYHNSRVYCEFARPSTAGRYQIRFQGGGGTYVIPVSIAAATGPRAHR